MTGEEPRPVVVLAFDKYRGTATSPDLNQAGARAAAAAGWRSIVVPLADGGEGSLEVVGGPNRVTTVPDPLARPVEASWRMDPPTAYIEMAAASGLGLVGGVRGNDPWRASTVGTGRLIQAALDEGATRIVVFLGGSATTDGGEGALGVIGTDPRLAGVELIAAVDVTTPFLGAAEQFAPQKGADQTVVVALRRRLEELARRYQAEYRVDVTSLAGAGAAGGLAGGLAAVGARIVSGFEFLAEVSGLDRALAEADLAVTGEGKLDRGSFQGKVVGGVWRLACGRGVPVLAVVGDRAPGIETPAGMEVVVLAERFGRDVARREPLSLVEETVYRRLAGPSQHAEQ